MDDLDGMDYVLVGAFALVALGVLAAVALAAALVVAVLYGLGLLAQAAFDLVTGGSTVRQLRRIERERDVAIRDMVVIRRSATRQMLEVARDEHLRSACRDLERRGW